MSTVPTSGPMVKVDENASGRVATPSPRVTAPKPRETRPGAPVRDSGPFYDLSRWSKYNDLMLVGGFLTVVASVALACPPYSLPAAGVLFGAGVMRLAWLMGKSK